MKVYKILTLSSTSSLTALDQTRSRRYHDSTLGAISESRTAGFRTGLSSRGLEAYYRRREVPTPSLFLVALDRILTPPAIPPRLRSCTYFITSLSNQRLLRKPARRSRASGTRMARSIIGTLLARSTLTVSSTNHYACTRPCHPLLLEQLLRKAYKLATRSSQEEVSDMHRRRSTGAECCAAEEAYVDPKYFIPERWSTKPDLVKDRNAFFPFSLGMSGLFP